MNTIEAVILIIVVFGLVAILAFLRFRKQVDGLRRYFDLYSGEAKSESSHSLSSGIKMHGKIAKRGPSLHQTTLFQWLALFAGVLIQPFFQTYQSTHKWVFDGLTGWALFALIVSVVIFPAVYRNALDIGKPVFVQLATIFMAGLGWQSLLTTVVNAGGAK
jgi:hypothetical protein